MHDTDTRSAESPFTTAADGLLTANKTNHMANDLFFGGDEPNVLAPLDALQGAHKLLHGDSVGERVEGGINAAVGGVETAGLLGHGASALGGLLGDGVMGETIGGVGETLIAGSEMLAPAASVLGLGSLAFGGGYALGTGLDWLGGKLLGKRPSDMLADSMGAQQDDFMQATEHTSFYSDPAKRGAEHIDALPQSSDEMAHNAIYKMNMFSKGMMFDPQAGTYVPMSPKADPAAQAEPFANYAQ